MKTLLLVLSAFLLFVGCSDNPLFCSKDQSTYRQFSPEIEDFIGIVIKADDTFVSLVQESSSLVSVNAPINSLYSLETKVSDNALCIDIPGCTNAHQEIYYEISHPGIEFIEVTDNGSFKSNTPLEIDDLELIMTGSGKITIEDLNSSNLVSSISGTGDIWLGGNEIVGSHTINITGSGNLNAYNLSVQELNINISGSGSCRVFASGKLQVNISGSGSVYFKGNPEITSLITGEGQLVKND